MDNEKKRNCWELMGCGREPGGERVKWLGVCQTAMDAEADGLNSGENAGRICWTTAGSLAPENGGERCVYLGRIKDCQRCNFFSRVRLEEGADFVYERPDVRRDKAA